MAMCRTPCGRRRNSSTNSISSSPTPVSRSPSAPSCGSSTTRDNLYIAIYAYDRNPELISATTKNRDGNFAVDDSVRIILDPLNTRRNGISSS